MELLHSILREGISRQASDIHLKTGAFPVFRVRGTLVPWQEGPRLERDVIAAITTELLGDIPPGRLQEARQVDAGYGFAELGRFRVNVFYQRGDLQAALRLIPPRVRQIRELNLPPVIERIAAERCGLVLVTGATGIASAQSPASSDIGSITLGSSLSGEFTLGLIAQIRIWSAGKGFS